MPILKRRGAKSATLGRGKLPTTAAPASEPSRACSRVEFCLLVAFVVCGAGLRLAFPERMAVEHFDEGVYASNIWFSAEHGYAYPMRRFYAPPLLPAMLEWSIVLGGTSHLAVMGVNLIAGLATIVLAWRCVREWFGPAAGIFAAAMVAGSDFHALYSRTALTDVLLLAWLFLAVWLLVRASRECDLRAALIGGAAAGLAWLTKYNGWLPLAIIVISLGGWWVLDRHARNAFGQRCVTLLVAIAIASTMWGIYVQSLQSTGGYAPIAANHRTYVDGFSHWGANLLRQWRNLQTLDRGPSLITLAVAFAASGCVALRAQDEPVADGIRRLRLASNLVTVAAASVAVAAILGIAAVAAIWTLVGLALAWVRWNDEENNPGSSRRLATIVVAVMFGGLLVATPLYHPYPRLTLPWQCAAWLGASLGVAETVRRWRDVEHAESKPDKRPAIWAVSALAVLLATTSIVVNRERLLAVAAWQDRSGLERIAAAMINDIHSELGGQQTASDQFAVFVYGEPALMFHLRAAGVQLAPPVADFDNARQGAAALPLPAFFATGPHAHRDPKFDHDVESLGDKLVLVKRYPYNASDLVVLNHFATADRSADRMRQEVRLYRLR